jgi:hypothetical protein
MTTAQTAKWIDIILKAMHWAIMVAKEDTNTTIVMIVNHQYESSKQLPLEQHVDTHTFVKILPIHKDIPYIHNLHPQLNIPYMQCTNITRPPKCSTNACQIKKLTANYPTNYGKPHEYHMNTWPPSHENCQTQQSHTLPSPNTTTQQILTVLHLKSTQGSTPTHP